MIDNRPRIVLAEDATRRALQVARHGMRFGYVLVRDSNKLGAVLTNESTFRFLIDYLFVGELTRRVRPLRQVSLAPQTPKRGVEAEQ